MTKALLCLFLQILSTAGNAQNVSLDFGTPFRRADLDVRWNVPSNSLPALMWVYRALPTKFSQAVISNLMELGSFHEMDKKNHGTNALVFESADKSRSLWIYATSGVINYFDHSADDRNRSPTNLSVGVPPPEQMLERTKEVLPKLGISISEISKDDAHKDPDMTVYAAEEEWYVNHLFITNTPYRGVRWRRKFFSVKCFSIFN
jgi:hypothetical protein